MISPIKTIKGFTVLPILLPTSITGHKKVYHYIYVKKHVINNKDTNALFIVNLPINTTLAQIKKLFQDISMGAIVQSFIQNDHYDLNNYNEDINLTQLTNDGLELNSNTTTTEQLRVPLGCGIVEFLDKDGLNLALSGIKKLTTTNNDLSYVPNWLPSEGSTGSQRYLRKERESILDPKLLITEVSEFLSDFQNRERQAKEELNSMKELVDEDGFTLVVGSQRKTKQSIMGSLKKLTEAENLKNAKKMKKKEKADFYKFQIREKKKLEMNDLLAKFKQDQKRVLEMKEKRKFKPY